MEKRVEAARLVEQLREGMERKRATILRLKHEIEHMNEQREMRAWHFDKITKSRAKVIDQLVELYVQKGFPEPAARYLTYSIAQDWSGLSHLLEEN